MYIHAVSRYIPEEIISNEYFLNLNGLTNDWIVSRTGMKQRRKAKEDENTNTMALEAVRLGMKAWQFPLSSIDLIVGATYTPHDTIVSHAHEVQHFLGLADIPVVSISAACSSLLNAMEIVEGYFALQKATRALVVVSEHNTAYANIADLKAGHLWGDGAAAIVISKDRISKDDLEVVDLKTAGAANVGKALEGVVLHPLNGGLKMHHGRDVFIHACTYMANATKDILEKNNFTLDDLSYFIPHQANQRITKHVAEELNVPKEKVVSNLQYLGNTGCVGCAIGLYDNWENFKKGNVIVLSVFGGGYSYGAMLLRK